MIKPRHWPWIEFLSSGGQDSLCLSQFSNNLSIGRTEAEAPILWPPDGKSRLTGEDSDAGKDCGQEEKETTEDEMVGWYHRLTGHEFEQTLEDGKGQRSLTCCSPWGHKEADTTEQLNNNNLCP